MKQNNVHWLKCSASVVCKSLNLSMSKLDFSPQTVYDSSFKKLINPLNKKQWWCFDLHRFLASQLSLMLNLRTLYLLACQVKVTLGDSGLCCVRHTQYQTSREEERQIIGAGGIVRLVCEVNRFRLFGKVWHLCFIFFTSEEVGVMLWAMRAW